MGVECGRFGINVWMFCVEIGREENLISKVNEIKSSEDGALDTVLVCAQAKVRDCYRSV